MKILISGCQGFIGSFLKKNLTNQGHKVISIGKSSLNDYQVNLEKSYLYYLR